MELDELLGIGAENFTLVESSYAEQRWIPRTIDYMGKVKRGDVAELIRIHDESGTLIGIAIYDRELGFWVIFTDFIAERRRMEEFNALADAMSGDKEREVEVNGMAFRSGVMEFYSIALVNRVFCNCNVKEPGFYPRDRVEALKKLLNALASEGEIGEGALWGDTIEIGCGAGEATVALHELGISPITVDVNKCEICRGLEEGVLYPERSVVLDCSLLSSFFSREFDLAFGFMVGKLTPYELFNWEKVLREVPKVLRGGGKVLLTVSSEDEAMLLENILKDEFEGEIKENSESNGYFDRWIYTGTLRQQSTE